MDIVDRHRLFSGVCIPRKAFDLTPVKADDFFEKQTTFRIFIGKEREDRSLGKSIAPPKLNVRNNSG